MSRVGRAPIAIPKGVQVAIKDQEVKIKGPKGELSWEVPGEITPSQEDGKLLVQRGSEDRSVRALHGLSRALLNNMVTGVSQGFTKTLELEGVGYRVQQSGQGVTMTLGFSHPVEVAPEPGVTFRVEGNTRLHIDGIDKQKVGAVAARLRSIRPPNVYSGKGIHYLGENIRRKAGKASGRKK
jgi:large subunit ribosomal protein L6